jgi:hypothetical protein
MRAAGAPSVAANATDALVTLDVPLRPPLLNGQAAHRRGHGWSTWQIAQQVHVHPSTVGRGPAQTTNRNRNRNIDGSP